MEALLAQYGLALIFANLLLERIGLPIPAMPTMIAAGALATRGEYPALVVALVALAGCVIGDGTLYAVGRGYGHRALRLLCGVSLSPDSCVRQTSLHYERWGGWTLVLGKFLPGVGTVAAPLAGVLGTPWPRFLALATLGSALWVGVSVGAGLLFEAQVKALLAWLDSVGPRAFAAVALLVAAYIAFKWWQRRRFYRTIRMARITVDDLYRLMGAGEKPLVVDLRSHAERVRFGSIPGALAVELAGIERQLERFPKDREIIFFCSCPNEASAASAAKLLMDLGYKRVRPLLGGIDAWSEAGYALETLSKTP